MAAHVRLLFLLSMVSTIATARSGPQAVVRVNFSSPFTTYPALTKKYHAYNSGCVLLPRVARDAQLLRKIGAKWMRVDGGMGWNSSSHMPGVFGSVVEANSNSHTIAVNTRAVLNYTRILASQGALR